MDYSSRSSKDRIDWAGKEERKLEAQESARYYPHHTIIPQRRVTWGGGQGWADIKAEPLGAWACHGC